MPETVWGFPGAWSLTRQPEKVAPWVAWVQVSLTPNLSKLSPVAHSGNTSFSQNHVSPTAVIPEKDMIFSVNSDSIPFSSIRTPRCSCRTPHIFLQPLW